MTEDWFVRVQGKEYGPVDLETLQEWKAEGRLIAENEVRPENATEWRAASEFPELFRTITPDEAALATVFRRRSFAGLLAESFRIYFRGFPLFLLLALLPAVPSFLLRLNLELPDLTQGETLSMTKGWMAAIPAVIALMLAWPVFLGGLQFATLDLAAGRGLRWGEVFRRSFQFWPRLARLSLLVYGNYFFWTALPLLAVALVAGSPSIFSFLLAVFALGFQVYMVGRLFINFLFWQQSATIGDHDGVAALAESKELARSRRTAPFLERPLARGAIIASLWLVLLVLASAIVEVPYLMVHLQGVTSFEQAIARTQELARSPMLDLLSSAVHAVLRPLLGIAFVLLYFDARAER